MIPPLTYNLSIPQTEVDSHARIGRKWLIVFFSNNTDNVPAFAWLAVPKTNIKYLHWRIVLRQVECIQNGKQYHQVVKKYQ